MSSFRLFNVKNHPQIYSTTRQVLYDPPRSLWYVPSWFWSSLDSKPRDYPGFLSDVKQFFLSLKFFEIRSLFSILHTLRWAMSLQPFRYRLWETRLKGNLASRASGVDLALIFYLLLLLGGTKIDVDNEVIIITSCLRTAVDFWERTNISQHSCQVLCTYTIAMIIFSAVMNDNYCQIPLPITFGYTTSPSEILCSIFKLCQVCRKPQPCWQCVFKPQHNWFLE